MSCSECYQYEGGRGCEFRDFQGEIEYVGECMHYIHPCVRPMLLSVYIEQKFKDEVTGMARYGVAGRPVRHINSEGEVFEQSGEEYLRVGHNVIADVCRSDGTAYR